jgi:hypothetical protein
MADLKSLRENINQARSLVSEKRSQANEISSNIQSASDALPNLDSQQALRGQRYGTGLKARANRQLVNETRSELEGKKQEVNDYMGELDRYEREVIDPADAQVTDLENKEEAVKIVNRAIDQGKVGYLAIYGNENPYVTQFAKEIVKDQESETQLRADVDNAIESYNSGVPLAESFRGLNIEFLTKHGYIKFESSPIQEEVIQASNNFNSYLDTNKNVTNVLESFSRENINVKKDVVPKLEKVSKFSTGIGLVSARDSSDNNLNNVNGSVGDGQLSNGIPLRQINSSIILDNSKPSNRSGFGGFVAGLFDSIKGEKEVYSPEAQAFVSASPTGRETTAFLTPLSPEKYEELVVKPSQNLATIPLPEIRRRNQLINDVSQVESKIDLLPKMSTYEGVVTTPSPEANNLFNDYYTKQRRLEQAGGEYVKAGLYNQRISLREFSNNPFSTTANVVARQAGDTLSMVAPEKGYLTIPSQEFSVTVPSRSTIEYDLVTGKPKPNELKGTFKEQQLFTKEQLRKTGEVGTRMGLYLVPYVGTTLFAGEGLYNVKNAGYDPVKYAKENPLEAGTLLTIGLVKGGAFALSKSGVKLTKEGKYLSDFEKKEYNLRSTSTKEQLPSVRNKAVEVATYQNEGDIWANIKVKDKGVTNVDEYTQDFLMKGEVNEQRLSLFGRKKDYKGTIEVGENTFKETINYDKGIKKVTELKDGKGTIKLFDKKGREMLSRDIEATSDVLGLTKKVKSLKSEVDKTVKSSSDLTSTRFIGKQTVDISRGVDLDSGTAVLGVEKYGLTDVIQVTPRKGLLRVQRGKRSIELQKQQAQNIELGYKAEKDTRAALYDAFGNKITSRTVSPTQVRKIEEAQDSELFVSIINPKSKRIKELKAEQARKVEYWNDRLGKSLENNSVKKLKDKVDLIEKSNKNNKPITVKEQFDSSHTYTGGTGGDSAQSAFAYTKEKFTDKLNLEEDFTVLPTEDLIKGRRSNPISLPTGFRQIDKSPSFIPLPKSRSFAKESDLIKGETMSVQTESPKVLEGIKSSSLTKDSTDFNSMDRLGFVERGKSDNKSILNSKNSQNQIDVTKVKESPQQSTRQVAKELFNRMREETKRNRVKRPKEPPTKIKIKLGSDPVLGSAKSKLKKLANDLFEAEGRVKGEDVSLGTAPTKFLAEKKLKSFLKGTLGASGKVKKNNIALEVEDLDTFSSSEFGRSKKDSSRVVQKSRFRLGTKSEVNLIKSAKKSKSKGWFS